MAPGTQRTWGGQDSGTRERCPPAQGWVGSTVLGPPAPGADRDLEKTHAERDRPLVPSEDRAERRAVTNTPGVTSRHAGPSQPQTALPVAVHGARPPARPSASGVAVAGLPATGQ